MFEKRTSTRSPIELAASYGIGEDPRPKREAKINNVSSGGFCLTSNHKLKVGEDVELVIELDSVKDITIFVKVVWVKQDENSQSYTLGVQIAEKEGPEYEQFIEFFNSQL